MLDIGFLIKFMQLFDLTYFKITFFNEKISVYLIEFLIFFLLLLIK